MVVPKERTKCERMEATISRVVEPEAAEEGRRGRGSSADFKTSSPYET